MKQKEWRLWMFYEPVLRQECSEITDYSSVYETLDIMKQALYKFQAAGIAAPQIGEPVQAIIAEIDSKLIELINPKITNSGGYQFSIEGCLSIPYRPALRLRRREIDVEYFDRYGKCHTEHYTGLPARILQHEIDHLHGKLMTDFP